MEIFLWTHIYPKGESDQWSIIQTEIQYLSVVDQKENTVHIWVPLHYQLRRFLWKDLYHHIKNTFPGKQISQFSSEIYLD